MNVSTDPGGALARDPQLAALWAKLRRLSFDSGTGPRTFAARLASEQGWSAEFAAQAIEEYRRFVLLFALEQGRVLGNQAADGSQPTVRIVPSAVVDKVWHLHLLYTRSYWEALCRDLLGAPLHHLPADGSGGEAALLDGVYRHTLESYRRVFGQLAPESIWPMPEATLPPPIAAGSVPAEGCPEPAPVLSIGGWILASCPFGAVLGLLCAQKATAENIALCVGTGCVLAAAAVLVISLGIGTGSASTGRRRNRRRRAIYFGGDGSPGCSTSGGPSASSDCGSTHGGDGHSYSGGGHGCGGHGCGGHGCGGHGCGGH